jgi:glycosyltransferase involved in cell wall biosynthesis
MKLIVVIPALNEEATIAGVIGRIPVAIEGISDIDIVVIDDGSNDRTAELAAQAGAIVIRHPFNRGVGAAFQTGIESALRLGADLIVNMDGDGQFSPEDIPALIAPLLRKEAEFASCTRFADPDHLPRMPAVKLWGNRMMVRLVRLLVGRRFQFTDVSCGFRAYTRETALKLILFGNFTYTQETFISLASKSVAMTEVPLVVRGEREFGQSRVARSLVRYALQTSSILLRAVRDTRPLLFFGSVALATELLGWLLGLAVFAWWLRTGHTSPYQSVLIGSATFIVIGGLFGVLALIADMQGRSRRIQEQILYLTKRTCYAPSDSRDRPIPGMTDRSAFAAAHHEDRPRITSGQG